MIRKKPTIIIDTREQLPLKFDNNEVNIRFKKLDCGDYSIQGHTKQIIFERKSVGDLYQTLAITKNKKRFKKELEKLAKIPLWYLVIEGSYTEVAKGFKYSRVAGKDFVDFVMSIPLFYGGHIIFANNRNELVSIISSIVKAYNKNLGRDYIL